MSHYLNHYNNLRIQRPIACDHCSFSKAALPRTDSKNRASIGRSDVDRNSRTHIHSSSAISIQFHSRKGAYSSYCPRSPMVNWRELWSAHYHVYDFLPCRLATILDTIHTWLRYVINATAYLLHYLRWDVFHETSKGWILIQDTRLHVSGMQTGELKFIQKLCLKLHFSKNLVSPCFFVSSGQETWIICKDWECSRETVTILHTRPHVSGMQTRETLIHSTSSSISFFKKSGELLFLCLEWTRDMNHL